MVHRLKRVVVTHRMFGLVVADVLSWFIATGMFALIRYDLPAFPTARAMVLGVALAALYVGIGYFVQLHQGRARIGSLEELLLVGPVALAAGLVAFVVNLVPIWVGRSVPIGTTICFLLVAAAWRAAWRAVNEPRLGRHGVEGGERVLVVGAGDAGRELIGSMLRDPAHEMRPVGLLDDDPHKRNFRIRGVPVLGTIAALPAAVRSTDATRVLIAMPSAGPELIAEINRAAVDEGVDVKVLPATTQLLTEHVGIRDLRDIDLSDVLGRNQLDTDVASIAGFLKGKRVLVTGAGGSIGSELCRQINRYEPAELMMLDRDESALHAVQLSINGRALLDSDDVILCDIRDSSAVHEIFRARRPQVVFHAAALKHLPMLEQYPAEAVKTNVHGTRIILEAARAVDVERFVNISTDKAANPSSVLGYSKRIAERITAAHARDDEDGIYLSVRFGNVLGSRGSVLTGFAKQIAAGGPVTVTDPQVSRFFMTIEEACQLVIQAAAIGRKGEALVLEMGEPVKILDVAQQLIRQSGRPIEIEFTGLRPGEKLHEELFADDEPQNVRPVHAMVSHVQVPPIGEDEVLELPTSGRADLCRGMMEAMCTTSPRDASSIPASDPTWGSDTR